MFLLKYLEFCFSVKAFTDLSRMDLSISTSVSLLTRTLQHRESCTDITMSQDSLLTTYFFHFHGRFWAVMFSLQRILTVQVLILPLALLFFVDSCFEVHVT